jgi:adenine deaminase
VVAVDGRPEFEVTAPIPESLLNTVRIGTLTPDDLRIPAAEEMIAVGAIPGQIVTRKLTVKPTVQDGAVVADVERDLLKLVVVERHHGTGRVGVGLVHGFGLRRGALASSIAHDAHNIVAVGTNDADLIAAIEAVAALQGGLAAVADGQVLESLALPVAGILSPDPVEQVAATHHRLEEVARSLGSTVPAPFGLLSFMALSVIPEARVTDQGLVLVG